MDRMTIAEKLDYTHRRLLSTVDNEQEMAVWNEFLVPLGRGETFPEMVRYFTTRLEDVIAKLRQITAQNKPPGYLARLEIPQLWNTLAWTLIERKLPQIGRDLLVAMYEFQLLQQGDMRRRFYKGFSLQNLGWANYLLGDEASARKVVRLALLEEVFNTLEMDVNNQLRIVASNPAYLMLRQSLKASTIELNNFISFAREYARRSPERCFYPEDCYTNYLRSMKTGTSIHSPSESTYINNFNYTYFYALMDMFRRVNTMETLDPCLADIASYLFNSVADFLICDETVPHNKFNLIVRNSLGSEPLIMSLGNYLAVEWRYWLKEVHTEDLIILASKAQLIGINTLILFIRDTETSTNLFDPIRLKGVMQRFYQQEKINFILIKQNDLLEIERKNTNLLALIKLRLEGLKFGHLEELDKPSSYEVKANFPPMIEMRPQPLSAIINPMPPNQMPPNQMPQNQMPLMMLQNMPISPMPQNQMMPMMPPNQMAMMPMPQNQMMPMSQNQMMPMMPPNQMPPNQMPQSGPAMTMLPGAMIPPVPNQMSPGGMSMTPALPPYLASGQENISRLNLSSSAPAKTPRLVIRNTANPKLTENPNANVYKPMIIKPSFEAKPSFEIKPSFEMKSSFDVKPSFETKSPFESASANKSFETQILKPCTSCQNQTSLSCKTCSKPFCNIHINVSSLKCEGCANPPKPEEVLDVVSKLE
ncbi:MAG: prolamin [bacterium]|nr:MAG: prolamin [bacterium]